jgi:pyridoxine 5-phosphate synthase
VEKLKAGAALAAGLGLEVHAGHGLCFETVAPIAAIPQVIELNIGHFLIGEAIFIGLEEAIAKMRGLMLDARAGEPS